MSQHYSDPTRAADKWALPGVEVFYMSVDEFLRADDATWMFDEMTRLHDDDGPYDSDDDSDAAAQRHATELAGWYYWFCLPGCLPDSEPSGPYKTEQDAIDAAQSE